MSEDVASEIRNSLLGVGNDSGGWKPRALGIEESSKKIMELESKINIDPLTGLSGEYPLRDMLGGLQKRYLSDYSKGEYLQGVFIVIDADNLHAMNRQYGEREGGDDYLKAIAKVLASVSRGKGRCFRMGGDDFVLYLPGSKQHKEIEEILDRIDADLKMEEKANQEKYSDIKFGLSYAIASFGRGRLPNEAYIKAYSAMNEAKQIGERANTGRVFVSQSEPQTTKYE